MTQHSEAVLAEMVAKATITANTRLHRRDAQDFDVRIAYTKMPLEQAAVLQGPGMVWEMAVQTPVHLQPASTMPRRILGFIPAGSVVLLTADQLFMRDYGNFPLRFSAGSFGKMAERQPHIQRLRILFPELYDVAKLLVADRNMRRTPRSTSDYTFYAPFMRLVYAVTCQLIDVADPYMEITVRESDIRHLILVV